ncbi:hypothetical protein [Dactylosporangium aurantiacum]|uniref:hypothetical protein n=1 Tax=Dactylosporangium aurantiacum TaxID=35754 RepID=UPI0012DD5812|nr:hypothetical protein [Dactylosporangium aurantiacum]
MEVTFYGRVTLIDAGMRFEISAANPTRAQDELDADELAHVADLPGHPLAQVIAHD